MLLKVTFDGDLLGLDGKALPPILLDFPLPKTVYSCEIDRANSSCRHLMMGVKLVVVNVWSSAIK